MNPSILNLASRIVQQATREHPADAVLREVLKSRKQLSELETHVISRAVFAFFRWRGWLSERSPWSARIEEALRLSDSFARSPESFADIDLFERAVPAWLQQEMPIDIEFIRALQREPRLWLRAKAGQGGALAAALRDSRLYGPGIWSNTLEYHGRVDLFRTPEFHAGLFEVQDLSSQAVGLMCQPRPGEAWWDACAGEGGKLLHLSELMNNQGLIWASDRAAWRLRRLKRRAARAKVFNYRSAVWDGGPRLPTKTRFEGVLVDAPCSGVGTWHRNPHGRWTTTARDVHELSLLQQRLLAHVARALKPNGKLIYAVCTLTRAETIGVVEAFERQFHDFTPLEIVNPLASPPVHSAQVTLWPQQFGGNGMFIAAWSRRP
jgi:16S rRNA (cytosine967-C5)-methyltransferase